MHNTPILSMVAAGIITLMMSTVLPAAVWATGDCTYDKCPEAGHIGNERSENERVNGHRPGYLNRTGFDLLAGNSGTSIRLQMVNGYQFNERFSAGIGLGYVFYNDPVDLIPVYADVVYQLRDDGLIPFLYLKAGYSISILRDDNLDPDQHGGGPLLNPGLGFLINSKNGPGIYLTAGFNVDNSFYERESFGGRIIRDSISYRRISLGFGLLF